LIVVVNATAHKHTDLELALIRLADAQAQTEAGLNSLRKTQERTEANLDRLSAEMRDFASRSEREWREFRKAIGEEANRRGRLVEDVLAPSVPDLFRQLTGWQGDVIPGVRQWRGEHGDPARMREFDLVAWAGDHFLFLSVKSTIEPNDSGPLVTLVERIRDYFPEANNRHVLAGMASFYMDPSIVTALERRQLLAVGLKAGLAEILNSPEFKPREF
jgi:hypothetical protein